MKNCREGCILVNQGECRGKDCQRSALLTLYRNELAHGKYTGWLAGLTSDQLHGLLWLVGEFRVRSTACDHDHRKAFGGERRKIAALRAITTFYEAPLSLSEVRGLMRAAVAPKEPAINWSCCECGESGVWAGKIGEKAHVCKEGL